MGGGDRPGGLGSSGREFVRESALVDGRGVPWFSVLGTSKLKGG